VKAALAYVQSGQRVLLTWTAKFVDRVKHDILVDRLGGASDATVLRLRAYLNSGIMDGGGEGVTSTRAHRKVVPLTR